MESTPWCLFKTPNLLLFIWIIILSRECWPNWEDSSVRIKSACSISLGGPILIGYLSLRHVLTLEWDNIHFPKTFSNYSYIFFCWGKLQLHFVGNLTVIYRSNFLLQWIGFHLYLSILCFFKGFVCIIFWFGHFILSLILRFLISYYYFYILFRWLILTLRRQRIKWCLRRKKECQKDYICEITSSIILDLLSFYLIFCVILLQTNSNSFVLWSWTLSICSCSGKVSCGGNWM